MSTYVFMGLSQKSFNNLHFDFAQFENCLNTECQAERSRSLFSSRNSFETAPILAI